MGQFVTAGSGGAVGFTDMIYGPNGNLFVSDFKAGDVKEYDGTTGSFVTLFASTHLVNPQNLTFGPNGNLFVADERNVVEFDGTTGAYVSTFVTQGSGGLNEPVGLAFGPNGNLYVGDSITHAVYEYSGMTGAFIAPFTSGIADPHTLVFRNGVVFIPDAGSDRVLEYDATTGAFITNFVTTGSGGLSGPTNLVFATPSQVPEPSTLLMLGSGLVGFLAFAKRVRQSSGASVLSPSPLRAFLI